jgi:hypothetical protein
MGAQKLPYLNVLLEARRLEQLNKAYDELKKYAADNGLSKPSKGKFVGDVIAAGILMISPEVFFKNSIS